MKAKIFTLIITLGLFSSAVMAQQKGHRPASPDSTFGIFTEITPPDSLFVTPPDEDFWVISTAPADYDNDGDLDIAVLGYYVVYNISAEDMLVMMRNEGPAGPEQWDFTILICPWGP